MDIKSGLASDDGCYVARSGFADEQVYRAEQKAIFGRQWLYLAHESQLREKGDYVTTFMGETPVVVTRGDDNAIHAFVNSCSHRGLKVCLSDYGRTKLFTCPYHAWTYSTTGALVGIPQQKLIAKPTDKSALGMKTVPRIESYRGLIFGCFDAEITPLDSFLGNMKFYIDAYFDRFPDGFEVIGAPSKWLLSCNWKMPAENQMGDLGHAAYLHGFFFLGSQIMTDIERDGINVAPEPGHGAAIRLRPPEVSEKYGDRGYSPETNAYLAELEARSAERLTEVQKRIDGLTYTVYPNFSILWSRDSLRIAHPRGPGKTELWSWWIAPVGAPEAVKREMQATYVGAFGPGGMVEQEDSDAWMLQYEGSKCDHMEDRPYYYGLGHGEEMVHPELPGLSGASYNEHCPRLFYKRWSDDLRAMGGSE